MISIENNFLIVRAKEAGAELCSIVSKKTMLEYLWQAGKEWTKHAPVLFPIVGQLKDNTYYSDRKSFKMDRHGFARTKLFHVTKYEKYFIEFTISNDLETLKSYPFQFEFFIRYTLDEKKLIVIYEVKNSGENKMFFSVGGHPAFRAPLHKQESFNDYHLEFSRLENAERYLLQNGLLTGDKEFIIENDSILPLTKSLFYNDALVFKNLQSDKITLCSRKYPNGLHFNFERFPFFGIWSARDADFVCLEPWHGVADYVNHDQQLENKEGIINLNPGKIFSCEYSIEPF